MGNGSPHAATFLVEGSHLQLHAVHAVDTVNEQDQDEYERDLAMYWLDLGRREK